MADTTNLQLPLLSASQAQKHVTHNDALLRLDALLQLSVIDRNLTAPPVSPNDGDRYMPASGATGAWAEWDLNIAWYIDGVWTKLVPRAGWYCWVEDEQLLLIYGGDAWDLAATEGPVGPVGPQGPQGIQGEPGLAGLPAIHRFTNCRLALSGANLLLHPHEGNLVSLPDGNVIILTSAGVTLAPTGLTANTTYYIYLFDNSGTATLEASTIGHVTDSTTGIEIKSGDVSRVLVGMIRTDASIAFVDTAAERGVLSWFNRRDLFGDGGAINANSSSTAFAELSTAATRVEFLTWADEAVDLHFSGTRSADVLAQGHNTLGLDGSVVGTVISTVNSTGSYNLNASVRHIDSLAEGYHYGQLFGAVQLGSQTHTWIGRLYVKTRG